MIRVTSQINGLKLLESSESTRKNPLLEAITTSIQELNIGTPLLKQTRRRQHISFVSPDKLKPMNGFPNQPKSRDNSELKWKKKDSS